MECKFEPSAPLYSPSVPSASASISPQHSGYSGQLYPSLAPYMGMELNEQVIAQNMPEYAVVNRQNVTNLL